MENDQTAVPSPAIGISEHILVYGPISCEKIIQ